MVERCSISSCSKALFSQVSRLLPMQCDMPLLTAFHVILAWSIRCKIRSRLLVLESAYMDSANKIDQLWPWDTKFIYALSFDNSQLKMQLGCLGWLLTSSMGGGEIKHCLGFITNILPTLAISIR
jgi:hypothetical protein